MQGYVSVAIVIGVCLLAIGGLYLLARGTAVAARPLRVLAHSSGWQPRQHALSRFHARWYPLTLLFLAFDVEMLFMYPWALVAFSEGPGAVVEMFTFLGVLMVGVVWAWREGALRWV